MAATSTQPAVIDALVAKFRALGLAYTDGSTTTPVPIFDGPPTMTRPDVYVSILGEVGDESSLGDDEWAALGSRARYERYTLFMRIAAYVGGSDDGSTDQSDAQKTARDIAGGIESSLEQALINDPSLSIQNGGQPLVIWCLMAKTKFTMTDDVEIAKKGRTAKFDCWIATYNRLGGIAG